MIRTAITGRCRIHPTGERERDLLQTLVEHAGAIVPRQLWTVVLLFSALNFAFPITLTQARGKKGYEKAYFDYLDGKPESD